MASEPKLFPEVSAELNFPRDERRVLAFWKERSIFEKTVEARQGSPAGTFTFYEGPPTANGLPHNGHALTRVIKDLFPRYRTMRGEACTRKAGWDTHGLPVEVEVEKELGIHGKAAIEKFGIEPFVARCLESVFRYTSEWEAFTDRIGFWVNQRDAYVTYHRSYVESVWWALSELFKKGLLYRSHKVVWWWAQGGTALSSGEVGQGYKTVDDPSVYVAFSLVGDPEGRALLVWTTTPWTLPSNAYAAVNPDFDYAFVTLAGRKLVVASKLVEPLAAKLKQKAEIERTVKGSELVGLAYEPPFDLYSKGRASGASGPDLSPYWKVVAADFVTLDAGTGIVHIAPAFGEDDFQAHRRVLAALPENGARVPLLCAVKPDGTFVPEFAAFAGRWVKEADPDLTRDLKARGLLVFAEQYRHEYPFCWRSDEDPLIQYARPAWYIRTTSRIEGAKTNNRAVDWHPENIRDGRFGDFLANNVDWALSRERYWGTPLPIWQNDALPESDERRYVAISGLAELRAQKNVNLAAIERELENEARERGIKGVEHLIVHKPWVDKITFEREGVPGVYRRVSEVIDVWFDSGCMPFAQWGFPHVEGSLDRFRQAFPADFISEAVDQTRGWFYSLLMVSTLVFDAEKQKALGLKAGENYPHPYRTCIVLGHVSDMTGKKESKSKGNYTPPDVILERVRMEFAVVDDEAARADENFMKEAAKAKIAPPFARQGVALIAREDLEGLDVKEGSKVHLYGARGEADTAGAAGGAKLVLELRALKGLPRRVVLLAPEDREALGAAVYPKGLGVRPVEVPGLPERERVWVEDPSMPAPGADAFRWFFYASSPPWTNTRHSLSNVRLFQKDFLVKARNVYSFFTIYANIDRWSPALAAPPAAERPLLCRWALSELALTVRDVRAALDRYDVYEAAQRLGGFVEALSNWYVRRSRERFWGPGAGEAMGDDKRAAYATLHQCLVTLAKLAAPFVPFFAEELYQALAVGPGLPGARESVHLEDYPTPELAHVDEALSEAMGAVRGVVSLGLQVRTAAKLRVRQPLRRADVVLARPGLEARLAPHVGLVAEELNVHEVRFVPAGQESAEVRYRVKPNFRTLGPRVGKKVQALKRWLETADGGALRARLALEGRASVELEGEAFELGPEDIEVAVEAAPGFAAAGDRVGVVVLHTALDQALLDEGLAREIQSRLQAMRKDLGVGFTERVRASLRGGERVARVAAAARENLVENALLELFEMGPPSFAPEREAELEVDGENMTLAMARGSLKTHGVDEVRCKVAAMLAASVVRIYATTQEPDYNNPWQAHAPSSSTGSGVVVAPGRVLTGAHVVANATFLQVQKASEPDKFTARVEAVCHCADLALLAIDEEAFNEGVCCAEIGELATPGDRVSVVGFPVGGDEVSVTEGVVSRIEVQRYSHSQRHLLAVTVDAAINQGNSGGPVVKDDKVVGIAFQKLTKAENVGEMVPAPLLRHFLEGLARGVPSPIVLPDLAAATQTLENPILRRRLGLEPGESGVLVRAVEYGGSADGVLEPGDTLLEIGGMPIANNGSILYRDRYRTRFDAILGEHFVGDKIPVRFLRNGTQQRRLLELKPSCRLVPRNQYDRSPTYFVYGGLVFQPLTRDFLATWEKWWEKAPEEFVHLYHAGIRTESRQEVIVLSQVLADAVNVGYERRINEAVATVNGVPPRDMRDFVRLLARAQGAVEIRLSSNSLIVLDVPALSDARHRILTRYRVSADRSSDLGEIR